MNAEDVFKQGNRQYIFFSTTHCCFGKDGSFLDTMAQRLSDGNSLSLTIIQGFVSFIYFHICPYFLLKKNLNNFDMSLNGSGVFKTMIKNPIFSRSTTISALYNIVHNSCHYHEYHGNFSEASCVTTCLIGSIISIGCLS